MNTGADAEGPSGGVRRDAEAGAGPGLCVPFGSLTKMQAVRSNVKGFVPFRIPAHVERVVHEVAESAGRRQMRRSDIGWSGRGRLPGAGHGSSIRPDAFKCPHVGGNFVFGQEANVNSLDQMTSTRSRTRNIAMNIFEALMTRDENNNPILDLADSDGRSARPPDLHLQAPPGRQIPQRQADDVGRRGRIFDRYSKVGLERQHPRQGGELGRAGPVDLRHPHEAGAADLHREAQLVQRADRDRAGRGRRTIRRSSSQAIGTGPWQLVEVVPGSFVKLKRYDGYTPNTAFRAAHRLRRLQAGLLRHGDVPHRDRARRARGRA